MKFKNKIIVIILLIIPWLVTACKTAETATSDLHLQSTNTTSQMALATPPQPARTLSHPTNTPLLHKETIRILTSSGIMESTATISPTTDSTEASTFQFGPGVHVFYSGSNGWGVRINDKFLIFDYQENSDPNPPASYEDRNLMRGYIYPDEMEGLDTYVFVTHSHPDHFASLILRWEEQIENINYFFGWAAGNIPEHHYLVGPRAHVQAGGLEVYTINSHHSGVPEVAFLVKVDGVIIYHNGDYRADYAADYEYLWTITDHIDIAFVIGHPFVDHQYFQQAMHLDEIFHPTYMFAMNREGEHHKCRQFAELLAEYGVEAEIMYGEQRGDSFFLPRNEFE
jgi:L-ascorbate metabolism protein UlaG (beta-lactamase superfamily)